MKPIDYLFESANPGGTYSSLLVNKDSAEELFAFCAGLGIDNLVDPSEYHCTVIYSRHPCPDAANEDFNLPCKAIPTGFKILGTDTKVLVLEIYCPNAVRLHELFKEKYNATHDYPEYVSHITVSGEFDGDIPTEVPEFDIEFDDYAVEELDL